MDINEFKFKLEFGIEDMNNIFRFLETIPYGEVAGLIENLKQQIDQQLVSPESFNVDNGMPSTINTDYPV